MCQDVVSYHKRVVGGHLGNSLGKKIAESILARSSVTPGSNSDKLGAPRVGDL